AVASTKEDRYLIASLQLRAAAGANDTAAFASALETVGQAGLVDTTTMASMYNSLGGTYLKNKQFPQAAAAYQRSVALNPSNAVAIYSNLNQTDAEAKIDLFRLMQATGALNSPTLYEQYAAVAADMNNTNEARAVLDAGLAAKVLSPSDAQYREIAAGVKAKPMAT